MPKVTKKKKVRPSDDIQVYHFSFRWSVEHTDVNQAKLYKHFKRHANIDKFIFQAEDTTDNPHYQGWFHTLVKKRPKQLAITWNADFPGNNVQAASQNGKEALQQYAMKNDTRVAGPWADHAVYLGQDLWPEHQQPAWQKSLTELIKQPPGDRKMMWIYDPVGNNGKTKYAKTLTYRYDAIPLGYGDSNNVLNLVSKFPGKRVYVWNLTRAKPAQLSELDLYAAMESVKDGFFINLKYETGVCMFLPPHVVVMANHFPKFEHMSLDRWSILRITDEGLEPVTSPGQHSPGTATSG